MMMDRPGSQAVPQAGPAARAGGPLLNIRARIERLDKLPPMPEMTQKIIQLSANPDAHVRELVKVVELDPSLAAQIMRYASSPFFSYRGKIDSLDTAITRVLGFNTVLNLALGATAAKPFRIPRNVPLGLDAFWRHAVFSAALVQALSSILPAELRPPAGMAYLAGMLHNFGHLLLGHLFKNEFLILNKYIVNEPHKTVEELELEVLGTDHGQIGAWLMTAWKLPEEVVVAAREHHNEDYHGPHAVYAQLVLIADRLLKGQGMGDAPHGELPPMVLESLEIGEYQAVTIAERILEGSDGLEVMARRFAS